MTFIDFENYKNNRYDHQVKSEDFDNDHAIKTNLKCDFYNKSDNFG